MLFYTGMRKIAIIDDEPTVREILKDMITEAGYQVAAEGATGEDAVEICRSGGVDLVIMDVGLPKKDGLEAAREINRKHPTPVVMLTAKADPETIRRATEAGVMAYLVKPVRFEELAPAIELAIGRFDEFKLLRDENRDLKETLEARKTIEKAKGLLMEKEGLTEAQAFQRIRKASMDRRSSMKEVAEVVLTALEDKR